MSDDDDIEFWAAVARADRAARGECWYKCNIDGIVEDFTCQVHGIVHPPEKKLDSEWREI
jgi:hypothetical protein